MVLLINCTYLYLDKDTALAYSSHLKVSTLFWKDVRSIRDSRFPLATKIDNSTCAVTTTNYGWTTQ